MRKLMLATVAALALTAPAEPASWNANQACMRDGPTSLACEYVDQQNQMENERRQEQMQRAYRATHCPPATAATDIKKAPPGCRGWTEAPKIFQRIFLLQQHGTCCTPDAHARSKRRSGLSRSLSSNDLYMS